MPNHQSLNESLNDVSITTSADAVPIHVWQVLNLLPPLAFNIVQQNQTEDKADVEAVSRTPVWIISKTLSTFKFCGEVGREMVSKYVFFLKVLIPTQTTAKI